MQEWGHRAAIIKRFRTLLWRPAVMHVLRRAALLADEKERDKHIHAPQEAVGTPAALVRQSLGFIDPAARYAAAFVNKGDQHTAHVPDVHPLIVRVVGARNHVSTDGLLEFRAEVCPRQLVALTSSGIKGTCEAPTGDDKQRKKPTPEPESTLRMWIPGVMLQQVHPALVEDYLEKMSGKGKGKMPDDSESDDSDFTETPSAAESSQRTTVASGRSKRPTLPAVSRPKPDSQPLDWRSEVDRMLAAQPKRRTKKRTSAPDEDRAAKKRRVSEASFTEALRRSPPDDDVIDLTSD
jgi:Holliday junction resolvase YEN1